MAAYEVLLLNTSIPQIQAAQSGDTYVVPRDIAFSAALTLSAGTANGVPYLNGSKVLTSGSALTFDGTTLKVKGGNANQFTIDNAGERYTQITFANNGAAKSYFNYDNTNNVLDTYTNGGISLSWSPSGSEAMRLTSTGLGIGITNPDGRVVIRNDVYVGASPTSFPSYGVERNVFNGFFNGSGAGPYNRFLDIGAIGDGTWGGVIRFLTNSNGSATPAERARITSGGDFGLGVSSTNQTGAGSARVLTIGGTSQAFTEYVGTTSSGLATGSLHRNASALVGGIVVENATGNQGIIEFNTNDGTTYGERARITSGGVLLVNATSSPLTDTCKFVVYGGTAEYNAAFYNSSATNPFGCVIRYSASAPNGTGNQFVDCIDTGATRAQIRSNGGLANYQANDVNLSDQRTKKDIVAAPSYWDKIKGIEIVHFKYKDQTHDDNNVGVIAQQVEQVAPEFVDQDGWGETPEDGVPLKSIYTSDMYHAAIKALQEAMARIEQLEAKVAAMGA